MRRLKSKRMKKISPSSDELISFLTKVIGVALIVILVWSQNNLLIVKDFVYEVPNMVSELSGYKILHISDISSTNIDIYKKAQRAKPDIIVISGGYADKSSNYNKSVEIANKLINIAPVYYIYNKEDKELGLTNILSSTSATNIINNKVTIANNLDLVGLDIDKTNKTESEIKQSIYDIIGNDKSRICIAVATSEEDIDIISKTNVDILLLGNSNYINEAADSADSGKYNKGASAINGTQLFISGGVGNSKNSAQFRIFNFPELQLITLSDGSITNKSWLERQLDKLFNKDENEISTIFDNTELEEYKRIYN